jgi:hypothetical protein
MSGKCGRCGHETHRANWADRHPWPTAVAAVPLGIFAIGALVSYPAVVLASVGLGVLAYVLGQRRARRIALARRADYEHALIVGQPPAQRVAMPAPARRPIRPANLPTVPLRTQGA